MLRTLITYNVKFLSNIINKAAFALVVKMSMSYLKSALVSYPVLLLTTAFCYSQPQEAALMAQMIELLPSVSCSGLQPGPPQLSKAFEK